MGCLLQSRLYKGQQKVINNQTRVWNQEKKSIELTSSVCQYTLAECVSRGKSQLDYQRDCQHCVKAVMSQRGRGVLDTRLNLCNSLQQVSGSRKFLKVHIIWGQGLPSQQHTKPKLKNF